MYRTLLLLFALSCAAPLAAQGAQETLPAEEETVADAPAPDRDMEKAEGEVAEVDEANGNAPPEVLPPASENGAESVDSPAVEPAELEPSESELEPPESTEPVEEIPFELPKPQLDPNSEPLGTPPWARPRAPQATFLERQLQRPAEMLELFNIDESQLDRFFDERPLDLDEYEPLYKLLFRMPQFTRMQVLGWLPRTRAVGWDALAAAPREHRTEFFALRGPAIAFAKREMTGRVRDLYEFESYYEVEIELDAAHRAVVFTREIPQGWLRSEGDFSQPAGAEALFLKTGPPEESPRTLYFVTDRVSWFPDTVASLPAVGKEEVFLAGLGMDVSLFDPVRPLNRRGGVSAAERECFYALLAAAGRTELTELIGRAPNPSPLAPMLTAPEKQHGKLVNVNGNARRIMKIPVSDPDIQARFGIDHYYQLDLFVPLGDQAIKLVDPDGSPGPIFENTFPVTCCVLRLPEGKTAEELEDEDLRVRGFYFKLWSYRTEFARQFDRDQLSPMILGIEPELVPRDPGIGAQLGLAFGIIFAVAIVAAWFGIWRYNREDRQFQRETLDKQFELPPGESLDASGIEASTEGPDFSNLP